MPCAAEHQHHDAFQREHELEGDRGIDHSVLVEHQRAGDRGQKRGDTVNDCLVDCGVDAQDDGGILVFANGEQAEAKFGDS